MEKIIGTVSLVAEGFCFYALTYYMLLEPESWKVIIAKPYKGKPYRVVSGYPLIPQLLFVSVILFAVIGPFIPISNDGHHLRFAWFALSVATVLILWSLYVAIKSDRGFYIVAVILTVLSYLLFKGLLQANESLCWIVFVIAVLFAFFKRIKKKD